MTFTQSLHTAMDTSDGRAYIERVKKVVHDQLGTLDATARIEDTHYFNHSAIPDFIVTWPGEKGERRIYLRDSYESIVAGDDEHYLAKIQPVLLSLDSSEEPLEELAAHIEQRGTPETGKSRTLVTDVDALEVIGQTDSEAPSPLGALIRANFVRGARGHIDQGRASHLLAVSSAADSSETPENQQAIEALVANSFIEDAAYRINRTASLIDIAMHLSGQRLHASFADIGGRLSLAELRTLIPWLLSQAQSAANTDFWGHVGTLMTFKDLEDIRGEIKSIDVTPLVRANAEHWEAHWAYLGLARPTEGDKVDAQRAPHWSFENGRLGVDVGPHRILVAQNGQLIKGREGTSSARWEDLRQSLAGRRLAAVSLQGIHRSVTVSAEQSPDVRSDVEDVVASLEDQYFITAATVRALAPGDREGTTDLKVDFHSATIHAPGGASIRDLAEMSGTVLAHQRPIPPDTLASLLTNTTPGEETADIG